MSYRMMVIMTWQDQVHCYINISCHSPSVLCHKAAGSSQATLWRIGELFLWEAEDSKSSEWDQLLLKMRRKNSSTPELTKEIIHNESESLSAGGSLLRVVWKSPDNDDYISAAVTKTPFWSSLQYLVSGSLVTIFSNTRGMPSNGFCDWL